MFRQPPARSALLSTLAVLTLAIVSTGAPRISSADRVTTAPTARALSPAARPPCNLLTAFSANSFPATPKFDNPMYPLRPGTEFVLDGRVNVGGQPLAHQVVLIVTDLTKVVHGVRTVVLWDRDFNTGALTESELAFHAQDNAGNIWNLGEYPAQYVGGQFTEAPDTWFEGLDSGLAGLVIPGNPQTGKPPFLQAYAPNIIGDCGQVAQVGQHVCNLIGCYDNVLVVDETSPPEPGTQQKFYAPNVGNFQIGALNNDPQGETLVLSETLHLGRADCLAARQAALALEDLAYHHDTSQTVYAKTQPMAQMGFCETLPPAGTPLPTPRPTPPGAPSRTTYIPLASKAVATPTLPPAIFDGCKSDPNPASAPNFPVRIVAVDKATEVVTLQNVSNATVSVEDWNMCSLNGNQEHDQIFGTLAPGQTRSFPNTLGHPIWDDGARDDGALYNAAGFLVSYWANE